MWIRNSAAFAAEITHPGLHPSKVSPHESLVANWWWTHASCIVPTCNTHTHAKSPPYYRCQGSHLWIVTCTCKWCKSTKNPDFSFYHLDWKPWMTLFLFLLADWKKFLTDDRRSHLHFDLKKAAALKKILRAGALLLNDLLFAQKGVKLSMLHPP